MNGIARIIEAVGIKPSEIDHVFHVSTTATYAALEDRGPERMLTDILDEFISADAEDQEYGVIIHDGAVDEVATRKRRLAARS